MHFTDTKYTPKMLLLLKHKNVKLAWRFQAAKNTVTSHKPFLALDKKRQAYIFFYLLFPDDNQAQNMYCLWFIPIKVVAVKMV